MNHGCVISISGTTVGIGVGPWVGEEPDGCSCAHDMAIGDSIVREEVNTKNRLVTDNIGPHGIGKIRGTQVIECLYSTGSDPMI